MLTAAFLLLVLLAAYLGLSPVQIPQVNDKVLHFLTFFTLTVSLLPDFWHRAPRLTDFLQLTFYWILDTSRRRTLNLTLLIVTVGLGLGSEFLQSVLPNGRDFDMLDIGANILGSLTALLLCNIYHKRMLDRRRRKRGYGVVPQEGEGEDIELGQGVRGEEEGRASGDREEPWDDIGGEGAVEGDGKLTPSSADTGDDIADARK